ncbi:MAG: 50S ribosomal protein L25 [Dehalococcoidia bacterium]|nr:50S ribosomal protein L25 [Dehalococcoidia bacterium]
MAERVLIAAEPRTVLGKKVKQLRRAGTLPANVYGRGLESVAIQVDQREFGRTVKRVGVRGMFELNIAGESKPRYVVVRGLTRYGGTGDALHVDFYQVDPNQPIQQNVPLRITGESPAVRDLAGTLLQQLEIVSVRCLPLEIPEALEVDAGLLKNFDISLTVGDIKAPAGVDVLTDPAVVVATVNPPRIRLDLGGGDEGSDAE